MTRWYSLLGEAVDDSIRQLQAHGVEVDTGHWQGVDTTGKPDMVTKELINLSWASPIPPTMQALENATCCNMPWAEDHFQERVSRVPSNPGEQYKNWPWWQGQNRTAMVGDGSGDIFTHTYQERFWPKHAGEGYDKDYYGDRRGIRYAYGDLDDVVNLLVKHPYTRQATFPIFFPEDTGAVHGGRIPCTLHYHFLLRNDHLHLWYPIRSCDAVRHFRDDVYLAGRLCQWVIGEAMIKFEEWKQSDPRTMNRENTWRNVKPGILHFTAYSFHVHKGDEHQL